MHSRSYCRRRNGGFRASWGRRAALLFLVVAAAVGPIASPADAATFKLSDGLTLQGDISAAGRRYVTIATDAGARLVARSALREVSLTNETGQTITGAFQSWREGVYTLKTPKGIVAAKDYKQAATAPAAAAPASPPPDPVIAEASAETTPAAARRAPEPSPAEQPRAASPPRNATQTAERRQLPPDAAAAVAERAPRFELPPDAGGGREGPASDAERTAGQASAALEARGFETVDETDQLRGVLNDILSGDPPDGSRPASRTASRAAVAFQQLANQDPLREPELDYRDGVLGLSQAAPSRARSCARLSALLTPPLTASRGGPRDRKDRRALVAALGGDYAPNAFAALASAYFASTGATARAPQYDASGDVVARVDSGEGRISAPVRVMAQRFEAPEAAILFAEAGAADISIASERAEAGQPSRLIGVDAVALVVHEDNQLLSVTRRELGKLLSGSLTDWSMLENTLIGAPRLYLPPLRSRELDVLTQFAGVRRIQPRAVRYIADPQKRLEAALSDPMGVALVSRSAIGDREALAIGRPGAGARPTLDAIRTSSYPLILPVYARASDKPAHPSAPSFLEFLSGPSGQRALFSAGLFPVAACDPSTCTLRLEGLDEARTRLSGSTQRQPLTQSPATDIPVPAVSAPLAQIDFESGRGPIDEAIIDRVARSAFALARGGAADRALLVAARAGLPGAAASDARARLAATRAEAVALSLRCAGLNVRRFGVDASARFEGPLANGVAADAIRIEVLADPRR